MTPVSSTVRSPVRLQMDHVMSSSSVGVYVDDLFCVASHTDSHSAYHEFTTALQEQWDVEDEGPVSDLLNVEISREENSVVLRQTGYIDKLVGIHAPDGVPASHQSTKTPCDDDIRQLIADALSYKDDVDPALLRRVSGIGWRSTLLRD